MQEIPIKPIFIKKLKNKKAIKKLFPQTKDRKYILINKSSIDNMYQQEEANEINKIINKYLDGKQSIIVTSNSGMGSFIMHMYNNFRYIYGYEQNRLQYDILFHNCNLYNIQNMKLFNAEYNNTQDTDIILIDSDNINNDTISNIIENFKCKLLLFRLPKNYNLSIFDKYRHNTHNIFERVIIAIKEPNS